MVTLHEVITFLVSMQISISSLQTHNVNRCGRSRHLARKLSLRRKRSSPNVFEMAATETITSIILIKLSSVNSRERSSIITILHELNPLFTIVVTTRDIKSKNVYSRVNSKATTQCRKTESANGVHLEGDIGRAVQQECRDRSRMPSSA